MAPGDLWMCFSRPAPTPHPSPAPPYRRHATPFTGKVLSVTLTMNLSRLEALVNERAYVHRKLDHLLTLYARPDDKFCLQVRASWSCAELCFVVCVRKGVV
jgi:hypothetical protein